jgi:hypothetical protein
MPRRKRSPGDYERILAAEGLPLLQPEDKSGRVRTDPRHLSYDEAVGFEIEAPSPKRRKKAFARIDISPPEPPEKILQRTRREAILKTCGILRLRRRRVESIARWVDRAWRDPDFHVFLQGKLQELLLEPRDDENGRFTCDITFPVPPSERTLHFVGSYLDVLIVIAAVATIRNCWDSWFYRVPTKPEKVPDRTIAVVFAAVRSKMFLSKDLRHALDVLQQSARTPDITA